MSVLAHSGRGKTLDNLHGYRRQSSQHMDSTCCEARHQQRPAHHDLKTTSSSVGGRPGTGRAFTLHGYKARKQNPQRATSQLHTRQRFLFQYSGLAPVLLSSFLDCKFQIVQMDFTFFDNALNQECNVRGTHAAAALTDPFFQHVSVSAQLYISFIIHTHSCTHAHSTSQRVVALCDASSDQSTFHAC